MATGQTILVFDNVMLARESGRAKPGWAKVVLDLVSPDGVPEHNGRALAEYQTEPFAQTPEAPTEFDKRYVLTISEYVA